MSADDDYVLDEPGQMSNRPVATSAPLRATSPPADLTWWDFVQHLNGLPTNSATLRVLLALAVLTAGRRDEPVEPGDVAKAVERSTTTVNQALSRLKGDGWLYQAPAIAASGRPVLRYRTAKEISG